MLDELRQYACPWDDIDAYNAPSGGHDPAFIARDNLPGVSIPGYDTHVLDQFNVLDAAGQRIVLRSRQLVPLDERVRCAAEATDLHDLDAAQAGALLAARPWLLNYVRLYQANAALSATHWAMINKYMIKPMQQRDYDAIVVSNYAGTTHMWMSTLRTYMEARNGHPLFGLKDAARSGEGLGVATVSEQVRAVSISDPDGMSDSAADAEVRTVYEMAAQHNAGDLAGTRRFYTDDVVWHVQGSNRTSGDFVGIDALFSYFADTEAVTGGTLRLHPQTVTVSGDLVGVLMRVTARRADGRTLDTLLAQTRRLAEDGRWCEYWAVADDQDAVDAFWS
jgi:ketosteroid isomerase-like protein